MLLKLPHHKTLRPHLPTRNVAGAVFQRQAQQPLSAALSPSACTVAAIATAQQTPPQLFLLGFLTGGLVCSVALLAITAYASFGTKNFRRLWEFRKTVLRHVWGIFWLGLCAAKATLLGGDERRWKEAWVVLKKNMKETTRAAKEGVEAIRLEANLYAASMGKPGLVALQYVTNHLTPKFFAKTLEECLQQSLQGIRDEHVQDVQLLDFFVGKKPPELLDARAYELGDNAMAFDVDIKWDSDIEATMSVTGKKIHMTVPITVRNVNFEGVVRIVLSPLTPDPPGFGAALLSLPVTPRIGLDVRMAGGEITRMPWLRSEILNTLQRGIEEQYLWPRRIVVPSAKPPKPNKITQTMLSATELQALKHTDPLLRAEQQLAKSLNDRRVGRSDRLEERVDIQLKDTDCLSELQNYEEEVCIIDWEDTLKTTTEMETKPKATKALLSTLKKPLDTFFFQNAFRSP